MHAWMSVLCACVRACVSHRLADLAEALAGGAGSGEGRSDAAQQLEAAIKLTLAAPTALLLPPSKVGRRL